MKSLADVFFDINDLSILCSKEYFYIGEDTEDFTKNKKYDTLFVERVGDPYIIFYDDHKNLRRIFLKHRNDFVTKLELRKIKLSQWK